MKIPLQRIVEVSRAGGGVGRVEGGGGGGGERGGGVGVGGGGLKSTWKNTEHGAGNK